MAVYIRQSPPREGVRGGREDFKWESLTSSQDYDYYLGASTKIGLHSRGGRFVKNDWWTKQRGGASTTELDEELQRVKNFENELMGEALGQKPKNLLVGNEYEDRKADSPDGAPARSPSHAERKRLKKEKKKRKKEKKREKKRRKASRRRSVSESSSSSSSSSRSPSPQRRKHSPGRFEKRERGSSLCGFEKRIKAENPRADERRGDARTQSPYASDRIGRSAERRHSSFHVKREREEERRRASKESVSPRRNLSQERRRRGRERSASLSQRRQRNTRRQGTYRRESEERQRPRASDRRRYSVSPSSAREQRLHVARQGDGDYEKRRISEAEGPEKDRRSRQDRDHDHRTQSGGGRDRDDSE